jgi:nucleolar complex protein 2
MPVSKRTKKFEKNELSAVLKKRKDVAKIKQRKQMDLKKKQRKALDNAPADGVDNGVGKKIIGTTKDGAFEDMSMDQFFQGGFQLPEMKKKKSTKPKTGKRKRTPVEGGASEGSDVDMAALAEGAEDDGSDSESGDEMEAHKKQLAGLAEKDPEFYKHLKDHDPELLDFEDDDLDGLELSASEDEKTPRKKRKSDKGGKDDEADEADDKKDVSKKLIQKWKSSMEASSSLRATREVVLAFRSAAHLDDEKKEKYKYSISDSNG